MKPLPLPVRIAAGLAVTALDRARHLPEKLAELPVTVVSQALQLSMRVQQQMTELAIKGDDALSTFRPVEETPEWATFDEDALAERYDTNPVPQPRNGARSRFDSVELDVELDSLDLGGGDLNDVEPSEVEPSEVEVGETEPSAPESPAATAASPTENAGPDTLPQYGELSLPALRARLRRLDLARLLELLAYERVHANRPEFVGMLSRRVNILRDQQ